MTLFQRALSFFVNKSGDSCVQLLHVSEIISSISDCSNEWNIAATSSAADHERRPGRRLIHIQYPTIAVKSIGKERSKLTTSEWNELALARTDGNRPT